MKKRFFLFLSLILFGIFTQRIQLKAERLNAIMFLGEEDLQNDALRRKLAKAIKEDMEIIIVSRKVLIPFIQLLSSPWNFNINQLVYDNAYAGVDLSKYKFFHVKDSQFFVLCRKKESSDEINDSAEKGLKIDSFEEISVRVSETVPHDLNIPDFPEDGLCRLDKLLEFLRKQKEIKDIISKEYWDLAKNIEEIRTSLLAEKGDLKKIFKPKDENGEEIIEWDFYLDGHGWIGSLLVGVSPSVMQDYLDFFNKNLFVKNVFLLSCQLGGENRDFLQFREDVGGGKLFQELNYVLIVGSVGDESVWVFDYNSFSFKKFFEELEKNSKKY